MKKYLQHPSHKTKMIVSQKHLDKFQTRELLELVLANDLAW